jgi:NAD(P)-dependent dehydrogenase (short-subunit alcohol dehydrogenase family)|tara:strand:+ start:627 stop:1412 length:786 start_codon:yes stop_codon:yes gene_type:complete
MLISLKNKKALVTGGGTGIGRAVVKALADAGASVAFTSRSKNSLSGTLKILQNKDSHKAFKVDLSNTKNVGKFYKKIKKEFGTIDILINNIGHTLNIKDPFTKIKNWEKVMNLNFFTSVNMVNHFVGDMRKKNWGRIINITSIAGLEISGPSTFNASKAALTAYTKSVGRSLALEKKNIVMTAFAPGIVMTEKGNWNKKTINSKHAKKYLKDRTALGRFGEMSEITGVIIFLSSDHASFFHSSIIQADGGQSKQYRADTYL